MHCESLKGVYHLATSLCSKPSDSEQETAGLMGHPSSQGCTARLRTPPTAYLSHCVSELEKANSMVFCPKEMTLLTTTEGIRLVPSRRRHLYDP